MNVVFVFQDLGRVRYFESALEVMAQRDHEIRIVVERPKEKIPGQLKFLEALTARCPNVTLVTVPPSPAESEGRQALARKLRLARDYVHYLQARFDAAPEFRARAAKDAPPRVVTLTGHRWLRGPVRIGLAALERSLPSSPAIGAVLDQWRPDIVLVTPLLWFGSPQIEWVRSASQRGIPAVGCLFSWDNLTSKGALYDAPDLLTVWNETQRGDAESLHRVPRAQIGMTGAQNWDHWFAWEPSRTRDELTAQLGLPPDAPVILYLESSGFVGGEKSAGEAWLRALRERGGERARSAGVIFRPHPQVKSADGLAQAEPDSRSVIWPKDGAVPLDLESRQDFFDSIFHADAVVGVNTSSFIEAAILNRPALALLLPELEDRHLGTIHFHYLLPEQQGPLVTATSLDEHLGQLEAELADPRPASTRSERFVEAFIRPRGRDTAASKVFVDAIEACASRGRRPTRSGVPLLRPFVSRLARRAAAREEPLPPPTPARP